MKPSKRRYPSPLSPHRLLAGIYWIILEGLLVAASGGVAMC